MSAVVFGFRSLVDRLRAAPYATLAGTVLAVAAYLCVVNLDYAALWHDEAPTAVLGKNLLERGDIVGWDGRNLVGGTNGRTLNEDLRDVLPPLMYVLNAMGFSLFGTNEIGARIVPALLGVLSLGLLYLLLRQHLPSQPRLVFFAFMFAAWSPQLLLFFRQSRYYAFMVFGVIAAFYLYERYWRTRKAVYLAALTLVAALSFFNHYAGGAATVLSLATWHLLYRTRKTTRRQWLGFAVCGMFVAVCGLAYLAFLGVIGGERSGFLAFTGVSGIGEYEGTTPLVLLRLWVYARELFTADWISWPVLLWFATALLLHALRQRGYVRMAGDSRLAGRSRRSRKSKQSVRLKRSRRKAPDLQGAPKFANDDLPLTAAGRIMLMGALFAVFSALLSVQPVWAHSVADLRYYVGALPLLLVIKGLFVDWAWHKSKIAGAVATAVLLLSSAGAAPFNLTMHFSGERTLGLHLFQFVREIHRPYRDSVRAVSDYLLEHAEQNDLVYVPGFADREALTFAIGHRVLFCCVLDDDSPLPRDRIETLGRPLHARGILPDWIVIFGPLPEAYWEKVRARYTVAAELDVHPYPTQRPELNMHAFEPLPRKRGVRILRRTEAS